MARITLGLLFAMRLLSPTPVAAQAPVAEPTTAESETTTIPAEIPAEVLEVVAPAELTKLLEIAQDAPAAPAAAVAEGAAEAAREEAPAAAQAPTAAAPAAAQRPASHDVQALIVNAAHRYGLNPQQMLRVAWCESRWNPSARSASGDMGVFQFMPGTWAYASAAVGMRGASPYDPVANIEAASWLMKAEGPRHWVCR
jgi:soluble lytic murein transglycosylase-like protein